MFALSKWYNVGTFFLLPSAHSLLILVVIKLAAFPDFKSNWSRPACRSSATRSSLKREVCDSNLAPAKLYTVLPTACHLCGISLKGAVLLAIAMTWRWAPQTCYTLQRNTVEYSERFDLFSLTNTIDLAYI